MAAFPVILIVTAAVLLGLYLGLLYLRGERKPVLIGLHVLLGLGGLEATIMLMHGSPSGGTFSPGSFGMVAAALFAGAAFSGLTASLLRKSPVTANVMVGAHVGVGALGFVLFLAWVSSL
jgi:hypothetical protein